MSERERFTIGGYHTCPTCKVRKFVSHPGEYAYKKHIMLKNHSVLAFFCSWKCLRTWEREHPSTKRKYFQPDA